MTIKTKNGYEYGGRLPSLLLCKEGGRGCGGVEAIAIADSRP
jgi:hypothetical protein